MDHFKMEWRMDGKSKEEKKMSDDAFKRQFKVFSEYMKRYGYVSTGTSSIARVTDIDVVEYIGFQKDMYGRKYFTVNYAICPLCERMENGMSIGFGARIGSFYTNIDQWFGYLNDKEAKESFDFITQKIEQYVLPWFKQHESKKALMTYVINHTTGLNNNRSLLLARNLSMKFGETAMARRCDELYQQKLPNEQELKEPMEKLKSLGKKADRFRIESLARQLAKIQKYNDEKEHINTVGTEVYIIEQEFDSAKVCRLPKAFLQKYEQSLLQTKAMEE